MGGETQSEIREEGELGEVLPECVPIVGVSWKDEGEVVVSETFRNLR